MLVDDTHRRWVLKQAKDEHVRFFWVKEFAGYGKDFGAQVTAPLLNKLGAILASPAALTDWAKRQLASLLGIQWNKWFQTTTKEEQADEINRRLWRNSARMRLRTSRMALEPNGKAGVLRAIVTPSYSPISDSHLGNALKILLWPIEQEPRILRFEITDCSVTYVMSIGKPFRPGDDKPEQR